MRQKIHSNPISYACRALALAVLTALLAGCPSPQTGTRYFLVGERNATHGDSYILPLTDPGDIAHALSLIQKPNATDAPIVVADIAPGSQAGEYINRDLLGTGQPWSWHVTDFQGFADFTVEVYDSWPTYVEDNYADYVASSGGTIGFWSYTVLREISPCEMSLTCDEAFPDYPQQSPLER